MTKELELKLRRERAKLAALKRRAGEKLIQWLSAQTFMEDIFEQEQVIYELQDEITLRKIKHE